MTREQDRNEEVVRRFYDALTEGNVDAALEECADDFTLHIPGDASIAGTVGRTDLGDWLRRITDISGGTYRLSVIDVLTSDTRVAAYLHHRLDRDGDTSGYQSIQLWEVRDGKLVEGREYSRDQQLADATWR